MGDEQKLDYRNQRWQGHTEDYFVALSDATLHKHLNIYLQAQGVCTLSYLELMERVKQIQEQQYEAFQRFRCLDYWLTCEDADVLVRPLSPAACQRWKASKCK